MMRIGQRRPRRSAALLAASVVAGLVAVGPVDAVGVASAGASTVSLASTTAPSTTPGRTGPPRSIAVLGDSISAGTGAAGSILNAGQEQKENSWATGTAGGLNSMYQRLLALQPAASGKNYNQSANGKRMSDAAGQASSLPTDTQYVVIQMGGNDLCKDSEAAMTSVSTYRTQFVAALNAIQSRVPSALVFVASIPDIYNLWYLRGSPFSTSGSAGTARLFWDGLSVIPCQSLLDNPTSMGANEERRLRVRQRNIDLNNVLAEECAKVLRCRFDNYDTFNFSSNRQWAGPGQAPSTAPLKPTAQFEFVDGDISTIDHFHPSFAGHRKLAERAVAASYDFTDATAPTITASVDRSRSASGKWDVVVEAADDGGVRGIEYRVHLPGVTPTSWSTAFGDEVAVEVPATQTALTWVETRALDRNGNLSTSTIHTVYPQPAVPRTAWFSQNRSNGVDGVRITWSSPADTDREAVAPVIAYEAIAEPGGQRCRTEAASIGQAPPTGCQITGLTAGQSYQFILRAETQGGAGTPRTAMLSGGSATSLTFVGKPAAPGSVVATPTSTGLNVSWSAPADTGAAPLTGYRVVATPVTPAPGVSAPTCTTTTATTCALSGLLRGVPYTVAVTATNRVPDTTTTIEFTSDPASVPVTLPNPPTAPTGVSATESSGTVTVGWDPLPVADLGPAATVRVTASPGGQTCSAGAASTSCNLTGLAAMVTHTLTVAVDNGVGTASASTTVKMVAPASAGTPFSDVANNPANDAYDATRWLRANNIATPVGNVSLNRYEPTKPMDRSTMALFMWRMSGSPLSTAPCTFTDVPVAAVPAQRSELAKAACWLKERGITTNAAYNPTGIVNRGQLAGFLHRLAGLPNWRTSCGFSDAAAIPSGFRQGACWLKDNGITVTTAYQPLNQVNRIQMASFLYRFAAKVN